VSVDLEQMMKSKTKAVTGLTQGIAGLFKKNQAREGPARAPPADANTRTRTHARTHAG
jgi:hypothetical protein